MLIHCHEIVKFLMEADENMLQRSIDVVFSEVSLSFRGLTGNSSQGALKLVSTALTRTDKYFQTYSKCVQV